MKPTTLFAFSLAALACGGSEPQPTAPPPPLPAPSPPSQATEAPPAPAAKQYAAVPRDAFNRSAQHLNLPLYWSADKNGNLAIDPDETAVLLFHPTSSTAKWVEGSSFSPAFEDAYKRIVADAAGSARGGLTPDETERRKLVIQELDQEIGRASCRE